MRKWEEKKIQLSIGTSEPGKIPKAVMAHMTESVLKPVAC